MCKMFISTGYGQCQVWGATLEMFLFLNSLHICASLCLGDEILVLNRFFFNDIKTSYASMVLFTSTFLYEHYSSFHLFCALMVLQ